MTGVHMPEEENRAEGSEKKVVSNHLAGEESMYLRGHAQNPVDWYPWSEDAFDLAVRSDRPVFLSIGYMSCHWCHVMARESYEDDEIARLLNEAFVCIKVDREERPDIDRLYMTACQLLTGTGGWPLHIIMTPGKKPFFAATYIPRETRSGMVGMLDLIPRVSALWSQRRDELIREAGKVVSALQQADISTGDTKPGLHTLDSGFRAFVQSFDRIHGGFGGAPKFPSLHQIMFLLRYWHRTGDRFALAMSEQTLDSMALGGIRDHIGGGFHRYSTDPAWLVPHFEKMLYDQALAIMAYSEMYLVTGEEKYAGTTRECADFVLRELAAAGGGFFSSVDADSEGEEGKFYLWTKEEIIEVLGLTDANLFLHVFRIVPVAYHGREDSVKENKAGVVTMAAAPEEIAGKLKIPADDLKASIDRSRKALYLRREHRTRPITDDRVLADWNGLMIAALSKASSGLNEPRYLAAAQSAADFIISHMWSRENGLFHRSRENRVGIPALADDYASMIWGLTELYFACFESKYLAAATRMAAFLHEHFWDRLNGGYFTAAAGADDIIVSQKEVYDGALPSPNAMMMFNCWRLSLITGDQEYERTASAITRRFSREIMGCPQAFSYSLLALDLGLGPSTRVVIAGKEGSPDTGAMMHVVSSRFLPSVVTIFRPDGEEDPDILKISPDISSLHMIDGRSTAYVCTGRSCGMPILDPDELRENLGTRNYRDEKETDP